MEARSWRGGSGGSAVGWTRPLSFTTLLSIPFSPDIRQTRAPPDHA